MKAWFEPLRRNQRSQKWAQRARYERQRQCFEALSLLQRYIDRELDPDEAEAFEKHLEACRACGTELRVYLDIKSSLAERRGKSDQDAASRLRQFAMRLREQE
ncbi:zf-HC2 domain-containing protein [Saccharopolyspora rhizosphaerae]|uniref:zf-HC2 domain-containing protein n=1 Tax=Saccharopolyspora rhizosphaerae TaxID=2492662 RepID=UPI00131538E6|nr:zf-HC2 domain-containing protein [Saccharopolyspora rhizosphaerae]